MTREEAEIRFAKETLSAYKKRKSRQGIKNGIGIVIFVYFIALFFAITIHNKTIIIIFVSLLVVTICGDLFFLIKTRTKKGCSGLYILWDMTSIFVMIVIGGFEIMYMVADLYKLSDNFSKTSLMCLVVSILMSIVIELIVDIIYLKKGKLQTKLENIKGPGGAVIYAIVSILTRHTTQSFAQMVYFLIGIICGAGGAAMATKIFYRLYLIKKHNLWDYFGYFNKDTPYDTKEGFGL